MNSDFWTVLEVASKLKLSVDKVRQLITSGKMPAFKIAPGAWVIYKSDFDSYIEAVKAGSVSIKRENAQPEPAGQKSKEILEKFDNLLKNHREEQEKKRQANGGLTDAAREARNAYAREYRSKHHEKVTRQQNTFWERKAERALIEEYHNAGIITKSQMEELSAYIKNRRHKEGTK